MAQRIILLKCFGIIKISKCCRFSHFQCRGFASGWQEKGEHDQEPVGQTPHEPSMPSSQNLSKNSNLFQKHLKLVTKRQSEWMGRRRTADCTWRHINGSTTHEDWTPRPGRLMGAPHTNTFSSALEVTAFLLFHHLPVLLLKQQGGCQLANTSTGQLTLFTTTPKKDYQELHAKLLP